MNATWVEVNSTNPPNVGEAAVEAGRFVFIYQYITIYSYTCYILLIIRPYTDISTEL